MIGLEWRPHLYTQLDQFIIGGEDAVLQTDAKR